MKKWYTAPTFFYFLGSLSGIFIAHDAWLLVVIMIVISSIFAIKAKVEE